jgi:hypothetical protein
LPHPGIPCPDEARPMLKSNNYPQTNLNDPTL